MRRGLAAFALLFAVVGIGCVTSAAERCSIGFGQHVALLGDTDDPDVFVWDSRFRLAAYQTGSWDADRALLPHALLAKSGTRAIVIACVAQYVHPKYGGAVEDAVGVRIVSGPDRGAVGWVRGADVKLFRR